MYHNISPGTEAIHETKMIECASEKPIVSFDRPSPAIRCIDSSKLLAMRVRSLFLAMAFFSCVLTSGAQDRLNVLGWNAESSVNKYLVQKMHLEYQARRLALQNAVESREAAWKYVNNCRNNYLRVLGKLPSRAPLHPLTTNIIKANGYNIESTVFESFEHHHVTANLYLPRGMGPFPAALLFCGHENDGKATESYQKTAILFVKNGFVVLVIDPVSQSERRQLTDSSGVPLVRGGTTEHTLLNAPSNLLGTSMAAYELWDNICGLDYLESRPEVDTAKIGCLGNSGGGMQTLYFMGFDNRVKVGAVCSFLTNRERSYDLAQAFDGCSQIPNEGIAQLEMSDYLIAAAPRPVLILAGRFDFIDYVGTKTAVEEVKQIYTALDRAENISLFTYDDGHGISRPKREAAVTWFRRWLCGDSTHVNETGSEVLPAKELLCTATGQVNSFFKDEITVAQRNLSTFQAFDEKRKSFLHQAPTTIRARIAGLLSVRDLDHSVDVEHVGEVETAGCLWHKVVLRKRDEVPLPLVYSIPVVNPKKLVVWFPSFGKCEFVDSTSLVQRYLEEGDALLVCDLRGMGESGDANEFNDPKYYNNEYRNAMLALHIGESLVGERMKDVLTVLDFVANDKLFQNLSIEMDASGAASLPALHALLFDTTVTELNLHGALRSFKTILQFPAGLNWYSDVVPDVLRFYDIPDIVQLAGAQKIHFTN